MASSQLSSTIRQRVLTKSSRYLGLFFTSQLHSHASGLPHAANTNKCESDDLIKGVLKRRNFKSFRPCSNLRSCQNGAIKVAKPSTRQVYSGDSTLRKQIEHYCNYHPSPLSIKQFIEFGQTATEHDSFVFLRQELPVRLANIMKEIGLLPTKLLLMPSCRLVIDWYVKSFKEISAFKDLDANDTAVREHFCQVLQTVRDRHLDVVPTMAKGVIEMRESLHDHIDHTTDNQIQYFLDRFYLSRISIRMLINQHVLLFGGLCPSSHRDIGAIDLFCNVRNVVLDAYDEARFLCDQTYLASPELDLTVLDVSQPPPPPNSSFPVDVRFAYVPSHLYHILFELLKNAMRATVEHHGTAAESYPKTQVLVCKAHKDLTIRIRDLGGGIPHDKTELLFKYMYSTAPRPVMDLSTTPLAGFGYGLPLSRLYAKYFNGDLTLSSIEGHGTDAYIYLKVLTQEANELLPIYNKTCERQYGTNIPVADWSNPIHTTGVYMHQ